MKVFLVVKKSVTRSFRWLCLSLLWRSSTKPIQALDIDALRIVAGGVNQLANANNATLLITHYQRLLDEITPDYVHVMASGRILRTGGRELALELEQIGYDWVDKELAAQGVA
jgi:Fe-S cluster assembly ATP-binding protein